MGKESIKKIADYLLSLAPKFFKMRIAGISQDEISELEEVAKTQFSDAYKEFLAVFGGTPPHELNPFLNNRDNRMG